MRISDWSSDVCSSDLAVDARSNNTAYQSAEGIDLSARYRFDLDPGGHIDFTAAASYIESERRLIESEEDRKEHTSELQSLMRISYAVFCLKKKPTTNPSRNHLISHYTSP